MNRGYDRIAKMYDGLSWLVFGNKLHNAGTYGIGLVDPDASILVVGGGTGRVLQVLRRHGHRGRILFVDSSERMVTLAKRFAPGLNVEFLAEDIMKVEAKYKFDVIHIGFFLDQFREESMRKMIRRIMWHGNDRTLWFISDFVAPKGYRRRILLSFMYRFFRLFTGIEASKLEDIPAILAEELGILPEISRGDWIWQAVYRTSKD